MMGLAGEGRGAREGVRMGVWGAAQATAFGCGGFAGAAGVDLLRAILPATSSAFLIVFAIEAGLFLFAALLAARLDIVHALAPRTDASPELLDGVRP